RSFRAPRPPPTRSRAGPTRADAPAGVGSCGPGGGGGAAPRLFSPCSSLGVRPLMRKLLLQLDSSRLPSVFDRVVAHDGGADEVMSYGGIVEADVRDLMHGCTFTRAPKTLKNTAGFIGGADMAAGERLLAAAQQAFFGPFRVSLMLDSNG